MGSSTYNPKGKNIGKGIGISDNQKQEVDDGENNAEEILNPSKYGQFTDLEDFFSYIEEGLRNGEIEKKSLKGKKILINQNDILTLFDNFFDKRTETGKLILKLKYSKKGKGGGIGGWVGGVAGSLNRLSKIEDIESIEEVSEEFNFNKSDLEILMPSIIDADVAIIEDNPNDVIEFNEQDKGGIALMFSLIVQIINIRVNKVGLEGIANVNRDQILNIAKKKYSDLIKVNYDDFSISELNNFWGEYER